MGRTGAYKHRKRNKHARSAKAVSNVKKTRSFINQLLNEVLGNVEVEKQSTKDCIHLLNTVINHVVDSKMEYLPSTSNNSAICDTNETLNSNLYDFSWGSLEEYNLVNSHKLEVISEECDKKIAGYRIVEIDYLLNQTISLQANHWKNCTGGRLEYKNEKRKGLVSTFTYKCNICDKELSFDTENQKQGKSLVNTAAVWGTLATGSTYAHLSELLSIMDVPTISGSMFFETQRNLGYIWKESLWEIMEAAGVNERSLALERGDVDSDGVPYITVLLDGGWSKRSYGHSYNAASGVAVIIGRCTGKLLYLGIRNKFCLICARAENKSEKPYDHLCFKNWSGASSSMEPDIIVEGFNNSVKMHNLRYKKFIADGDSTVFTRIKQHVDYGSQVEKIECTNHCIKNYSKHLYNIKRDTKSVSLEARKMLTSNVITGLVKMAQKAIYSNAHGDIETLKYDIRNSVQHVFGNHADCNNYICDSVGDVSAVKTQDLITSGAHHHIYGALNLAKANLLIDNETNNRAELFMSILARFNMGKRLNLIQRDSFQNRSYLTGLRYNEGQLWHQKPWKKCFNRSPGKNFKRYMKSQQHIASKRKARGYDKPRAAKKLKFVPEKQQDYGPNIAEIELDTTDLQAEITKLLERLQVTLEQQQSIAKDTVGQFQNSKYKSERMHRLTASNFGAVIRRRETTSCDSLVKQILTERNLSTPAIEYGRRNESVAISKFEGLTHRKINQSGLYVDIQYGFLGASPDGIISNDEIVEVKCLHKVASLGTTLEEAVKQKTVACLEMNSIGVIQLKKQHDYYYQIQGQLAITKYKKCYFIVYSGDKNNLYIEEVLRDEHFWNAEMLPKLKRFYEECLAPEIILNRRSRNLKCKDPPYVTMAQSKSKPSKAKSQLKMQS